MGAHFVDRSREINDSFTTPQCATEPLHIKP